MDGTTVVPAVEETQVNANQQVDVPRIRKFFEDFDPDKTGGTFAGYHEFKAIKEQVLELCEIAEGAGFLKDVQEAREELDPESVLPSRY